MAARIARNQPLVFFNACWAGQLGWTLTRLGGWAARWVQVCGCGAFIAPQWPVRDKAALAFAQVFYKTLSQGGTLGEAGLQARRLIAGQRHGNLTALAYTLYGHPNARLFRGARSASEASPEEDSQATQAAARLPIEPHRRERAALVWLRRQWRWPKARRLRAFLACLIFVVGLVWWDAQRPRVDTIRPITPVIEGQLEIVGANFSGDRERVEVFFGDIRAPLLEAPTVSRLVVRVPPEATAGPLRVVRKTLLFPLFLDPEAEFLIPTVNRLQEDVSLLSEAVKSSDDRFTVLFSILNLSAEHRVTVHDIRLEMIVLVDLQEPSLRRRRIDLGSFAISGNQAPGMRQLNHPVTTLLPEGFVVELLPRDSEAFHFTISRPNSAHKLHMMFAISASYYDDRGRRGRAFSDRIFNLLVNHLEGFAWCTDLPLDSATLDKLARKYGESFHGVAGLHDMEGSP